MRSAPVGMRFIYTSNLRRLQGSPAFLQAL